MSEIKVFVYDTCGKKEEVGAALERAGISLVGGEGEAALLAADYLLLSTADARELDDREVSQAWNFYLDELRWKRKESGEVIIIDCSDISFSPSRLAYGLKKCKRFRLKQIDEATRYMTGGKQSFLETAIDIGTDSVIDLGDDSLEVCGVPGHTPVRRSSCCGSSARI